MEGSTQDRRKDAGRRRTRSRAAFKDQRVLLIDQREEVWIEHAPAGKWEFDSCQSSQFLEASCLESRNAPASGGKSGIYKAKVESQSLN